MIHDSAQKDNTASRQGCNVDLFLVVISHPLVKDPELAAVALLPVWVEVHNRLSCQTKNTRKGKNKSAIKGWMDQLIKENDVESRIRRKKKAKRTYGDAALVNIILIVRRERIPMPLIMTRIRWVVRQLILGLPMEMHNLGQILM